MLPLLIARQLCLALLLAALVTTLVPAPSGLPFGTGPALATDDDDDDDDDDDRRPRILDLPIFRLPQIIQQPRAPRPQPQAQPEPEPEIERLRQARREVVVDDIDEAGLQILLDAGYRLLERRDRDGDLLVRLRVRPGVRVRAAAADIDALVPATLTVPNTYYRPEQQADGCAADICVQWQLIDWQPQAAETCALRPRIGVVDTGVNLDHDFLIDADLTIIDSREAAAPPSDARHGTAIVAMLVGAPDSRVPGLLPEASLVVADPYSVVDGDERADVYSLVRAIDALLESDVEVINLSLAGLENEVLQRAVERAAAEGVVLVASVGNAGPASEPLYPAAYDGVIAVTAVDNRGNVYRRAVQGGHVDFAAPGVEVPTAASISGIRPQTGTSFAAPFVTAAVALALAADPEAGADALVDTLAATASDLGEDGRDDIFGWGMVQRPICAAPELSPVEAMQ